ncbi:M13 family metallopeptidase [Uliginosibacterium gangwonense]|uniref:M13 family metallopeptidase n=1 Tax=Uliginosibacterium gangwonense TaxID=392736 RepID=UPI000370D45F|nr:M13 family metallopeptidase [Uliginosibacterium gangwonense]
MQTKLKLMAGVIPLVIMGSFGVHASPLHSGIEQHNFDPSVRMQDNFHLAINGGWIKRTQLPPDEGSMGVFRMLYNQTQERSQGLVKEAVAHANTLEARQISAMYRSFMDEARADKLGITPISSELKAVDALDSHAAVIRQLGQWQGTGISGPLALHIDIDDKNPSAYIPVISQDGLAMPDRDYYLEDDPRFVKARQAYTEYLKNSFAALGLSEPEARAARVLALETEIARLHWDKVTNRDPIKTYNKVEYAELATTLPGIDWQAFFTAARTPALKAVNVNQPSYVTALAKLLEDTPVSTWQDYLRVRVFDAYAPYLDGKTAARHFAFHGTALNGTPQMRARWKRALRLITETQGENLGKLYVAKYFPAANKARMLELVHNLLAAYDKDIDTLEWMGEESRRGAHEKLAKLTIKIGYPDKWRDYCAQQLDAKDLVGNVRQARKFEYDYDLAHLNDPVDRTRWWMAPQIVNAYYNPTLNEIVFPAAILQPPFFDMKADDAVNYGSIGAIIGHEISHGFDDWGSQYNADGKLEPWMSEEDHTRFKALTQKLVDQYNHYEALPGKFVNGELTLGENIADNSGLAIAYKAYRISLKGKPAPVLNGLTGDQRFFIGFAQSWRDKSRPEALLSQIVSDPHSPDEFRTIGPTSNSDPFQDAFGVKPGDKMYKAPEARIRIW